MSYKKYKNPYMQTDFFNFVDQGQAVQQGSSDERLNTLENQRGNYQERLLATGYDPNEIMDGRNAIQRFLGMNEGTGVIKGFFDIMSRPGKAVSGAFEELTSHGPSAEGWDQMNIAEQMALQAELEQAGVGALEKMKQGALRGLTQQTDYTWGNVLRNLDGGREAEGLKDPTVWGGMALDMLVDPVKLALFAASGGTSAAAEVGATAIEGASEVSKIANTAKLLDDAQVTVDVLKQGANVGREAKTISDAVSAIADTSKAVSSSAQTMDAAKEAIEGVERYRTIKATLNGAKKGLETVNTVLDPNTYLFTQSWRDSHQSLNQIIYSNIFKGARSVKDGVVRAFESHNPEAVEGMRGALNDLVESSKRFFGRSDYDINRIKQVSQQSLSDMNDDNMKIFGATILEMDKALEAGIDGIDNMDDLSKKLVEVYEFMEMEPTREYADQFLQNMIYNKNVHKTLNYSDELYDSLKNIFPKDLEEYGIMATRSIDGERLIKFSPEFWNPNNLDSRELDNIMQATTQKSQLEALAQGVQGVTPDWRVKEVNFGTARLPEEIVELTQLYKDDNFRGLYNNYSEAMEMVQKNIGLHIYDDVDAIVQKSMSGYVPHTLNPEIQQGLDEIVARMQDAGMEPGDFFSDINEYTETPLDVIRPSGGTAALKSRAFRGTAHEANIVMRDYYNNLFQNERWVAEQFADPSSETFREVRDLMTNTDWFIQDARTNMFDLISTKGKAISNAKMKTDILLKASFDGALDGRSGLAKVDMGNRTPVGAEILSTSELHNLKNSLANVSVYGGESDEVKKLMDLVTGGIDGNHQVALDKHLRKFVGTVTKTDGHQLLDTFDKVMGEIRANKLMSPGYNIRNVLGNTTNMWLSGMNVGDIMVNINDANEVIRVYEAIEAGLDVSNVSSEILEGVELYRKMMKEGAAGTTYKYLMDMEGFNNTIQEGASWEDFFRQQDKGSSMREAWKTMQQKNMDLNQAFDDRSRLAIALHAQKTPAYLERLGVIDNAIDASRLVMFDPSDLTLFEKDVVKRATMFYTFARQNIAFHAKNLLYNTDRYYDMYRRYDSLWSNLGIEEDERSEWDSLFNIPFGQDKEEGTYNVFKMNNPFDDFMDFTSRPVHQAVNKLAPPLKAPFELATDKKVWDGRPVSDNYLAYMFEQTGLDVPAKFAGLSSDGGIQLTQGEYDEAFETLGKFLGTWNKRDSMAQRRTKTYREMERLREFIEEQKKQGIDIPTLTEMRGSSKNDFINIWDRIKK